ncbi:MAG: hypothetical protein GTN38_03785 [Candidatus Aenigmarchaeota archaeon]|nr:hypothetical protein [Candidatus Aenigmarchaeota archaeon]NIP40783.1 hypothetical protein [Candidatus Aenigmarchaeota archaeon]NIQ17373.1 hypothetical protein [Candidatus Aenigmarchaeota archaeon]NIS73486.1 hypothetical protein [Candidatus Aenigmarchaeota archaeon]
MNRSELFRKMEEIISFEDEFVQNLSSLDITNVQHSHFSVTNFLKLKSGLTKLMDDSRRHKELLSNLINILSGDPRDEY